MTLVFFHGEYRVFYDGSVWYDVVDNKGNVVDGFMDASDAVSYVYFLDNMNEDEWCYP